jgi:adenine-specific DNA-methyltransferase
LFDNSKEKIICPYKAKANSFALNNTSICGSGDIYAIKIREDVNLELKYILGLLNSKLLNFYFSRVGKKKGNLFEYYTEPLKEIPIHIPLKIEREHYIEILKLITLIQDEVKKVNETDSNTNTKKESLEKIDETIDQLVYKLYGLNKKEIKLIEESLKN